MNTITPSLTPKASRMSGASTVIVADSSSSRLLSTSRMMNVNAPAAARPARRLGGSSSPPTPGRRSSATTWLLAARLAASSSITAAASDATDGAVPSGNVDVVAGHVGVAIGVPVEQRHEVVGIPLVGAQRRLRQHRDVELADRVD